MTTLILWAGLGLAAALAFVIRRPEWRIPALAFAIVALPGNVDNLLPQMTLDPNPIANNTAPVLSVVDILIGWAALLTWREGRLQGQPGTLRVVVAGGAILGVLAAASAVVAMIGGVDVPAGIRGIFTFARIPILLGLVIALRGQLRHGELVAFGVAGGLLSLVANGLYFSGTEGLSRFTAATFGRNGFAFALVACALVCAGAGFESWGARQRWSRVRSWTLLGLAAAGLFAAIATGTRMALLAMVMALVFALVLNRTWLTRAGVVRVATVAAAMIVIAIAAALWTAEGGRALAVLTDPGETAEIVFDPGDQPDYSPVHTRTHFWELAVEMAAAHPLTGVGPFQWNILRYELRADEPPLVADVHNTYFQVAAEYGVLVLAGYVALMIVLFVPMLIAVFRNTSLVSRSWQITLLAMAAVVYPVTELTNSHFFNIRLGAFGWLLLALAFVMVATADATESASDGGSPNLGA